MRTPGIYSAFSFSFFLHILIVAISVVIIKHSGIHKKPLPYIINIVDEPATSLPGGAPSQAEEQRPDVSRQTPVTKMPAPVTPKQKNLSKKDADKILKERIEAMQAKKKIEKIVALRKTVEIGSQRSIQQAKTPGTQAAANKPGSGGASSGGVDYQSTVMNKIKQQWIFPESIDKDLLAVIIIRIAKDGSITIGKIEKSSGNPLFDRSALSAIRKASPLPPPPQEMEIGVNFRP